MSENQNGWMERELEQSLRRVAAPEELWDRFQSGQPARTRVHSRFMALAATVPVAMLAALIGSHSKSVPGVQFRSSDPVEIQAWVKSRTGFDVPMHSAPLAGASVAPGRGVEIAYRGQGSMRLLVSEAAAVPANSNILSWTRGGLTFQLASAEQQDLKSCALCHVGS